VGTNSSYSQWFWYLLGVAALLLFVRLGAAPIYILDEAKNAQCAREMWQAGNWIYPTFNGELRTDKPALHYWFMILSYSFFGEGAAQARLFSAFLGVGVLWLTFYYVRKFAGDSVAFFSVLTLALSPHFLFEFRLSVPDPYLIFFTTAGLFFGFRYIHDRCRKSLITCAVCLGLAVLAKGPVALLLPGLVFIVFFIFEKKWWVIRDPFLLFAIIVAIVVAFPWYYSIHLQSEGAFTKGFFLDHNLNRFSAEKEGHGGPFIITSIIVLVGLLPFSLCLPESLKKKFGYWKYPLFRFSAIVSIIYVVFFSISSTKLPNYPMPCYPFAAILVGFYLKGIFEGKIFIPAYVWWMWISLSIIIVIAAFFGLRAETSVSHLTWIAFLLILLPLGTCLAFFKRFNGKKAILVLSITWLLFSMFFLWVGYPLVYKENPVTKLLPIISKKENAIIVTYKSYNPGFNFNLESKKMILSQFKDVDHLKEVAMKNELSARAGEFFVISRLEYLDEFKGTGFIEIARERDLFELPTTIILKWRP
jgi:4-amino-4-deoxy-L-arabinose transferase-like glycosyltransferase